jgi:hypothetical protein
MSIIKYSVPGILVDCEHIVLKQAGKGSFKQYKLHFPYEKNEAGEIINIGYP